MTSLSSLLLSLAGAKPTIEQIRSVNPDELKEWARQLNLNVSGRPILLVGRIAEALKVDGVGPAKRSSPPVNPSKSTKTTKKLRAASKSSEDEIDYEGLLDTFSDSSSDEDTDGSSFITKKEFLDFSSSLVNRIQSLLQNTSSSRSASDVDWWLNLVVEFKLGVYLKSRSGSAEQHVTPHLETIKEAVGALVSHRLQKTDFCKIAKPSIKRLLEWSICTLAFVDFKDLRNGELLIANAAAKEVDAWADSLLAANLMIKPASGLESIILGERISKLAHETGKACGIKMDPKHIKAAVKEAVNKAKSIPSKKPIASSSRGAGEKD